MPHFVTRDARIAVEATLRVLTSANPSLGKARAKTLTEAIADELGPPVNTHADRVARRMIVTLASLVWTGLEQLADERGDVAATELARQIALQITAGLDEP